jgi:hypothetical protein
VVQKYLGWRRARLLFRRCAHVRTRRTLDADEKNPRQKTGNFFGLAIVGGALTKNRAFPPHSVVWFQNSSETVCSYTQWNSSGTASFEATGLVLSYEHLVGTI